MLPHTPQEIPEQPSIGLTSKEAAEKSRKFGPNEIKREEKSSLWKLFLGQLNNPMIGLLFFACLIATLMGEAVDAIAIGAIVLLNAMVGFAQEYKAERALAALRAMTAPKARVVRDGISVLIAASEVVPGDLLILEPGDIVPADAQLSEAHSFYTNEAPLTGESTPVEKRVGPSSNHVHLAERKNTVFLGTSVARGTGTAVVIDTGMKTELGKIAHLLRATKKEPTPLQHHLNRISKMLMILCLGVVVVVGALGFFQDRGWLEILLTSISLAVAAVPEGLPAIVTIALALGVKRMANRNVLVRKLPAVETLGSVTVICTDKTGTLTTGIMTVRELWGENHKELLYAASACCDAELDRHKRGGTGDPTEIAILLEAAKHGIFRQEIEHDLPRREVTPFDSDRKRMAIRRTNGILYVKGAVESLLPLCKDKSKNITQANSEMAGQGLRVLAVAIGNTSEEKDLVLLGLIGIADPPRTEVIDAIVNAKSAGILTVMITGDHPVTAKAIAEELGIIDDKSNSSNLTSQLVHARATPQEKIDIIRYWKNRGATVAMTGDGVNDAPALKEAHIGIAMGRMGTEVAREASDMVLTDDNFASIIAAVQEGRGIYTNIQKSMVYLLTGNMAELMAMFLASIFFLPIPFLPIHLLWINLVTDGLPALTLVMDPITSDVLKQPPRNQSDPMLGKTQWRWIISVGLLEAIITLSAFLYEYSNSGLLSARSFAFAVLVFSQMFRAFGARSTTRLYWQVGAFSNLPLLFVILATLMLQISIHSINFTQTVFQIKPLSTQQFLSAITLGLISVSAIEFSKIVRRYLRS